MYDTSTVYTIYKKVGHSKKRNVMVYDNGHSIHNAKVPISSSEEAMDYIDDQIQLWGVKDE